MCIPAQEHDTLISGDGILLRRWRIGDAEALVSVFDDPDVAFRTPIASPFTLDDARAYLTSREGCLDLAVMEADPVPVGQIAINLTTHNVSYVIDARARGRGLATRALSLVCQLAHTYLGLDRVFLEIEPDNSTSAAMAQHCGFQPSGVPDEEVEYKGRTYLLATWHRAI